ncbi:MAG TPA: alpha/beta fold hydrolase [Solirubrobacterales bacterium]|nr:alpha/beta fold hydrolase [Solirubrobacterales bacterium]
MRAAAAWSRRHARALAVAAVALLVAIGLGVAASWHFSSVALVPDHSEWPLETRVEAVGPGRIVLSRDDHSSQPGVYGLDWQAGHAIVGSILTEGDNTVTRRLRDVRGYLVPEIKVGFDSHVYSGDPGETLGLPFRSVGIPDPLGPMPAWLVPPPPRGTRPATGQTWAIVVHGHNDNRQNDLRIAPTLRNAGLTSLLISYRNDLGAPSSPDGLYHLGETEWADLAAAIRYALAHGAHRIVLIGYSMGGALIAQLMERSPLAGRVNAIVLDAPVLDWRSLLEFNAEQMNLPGFLSLPVQWTIDARIGPNWDSLDALDHTEDFHLPILLFHTAEDDLVPISTSEAFASSLPHWVTYHRVPIGGHTEAWNVNPASYDARLKRFLSQNLRGPRQS